MANERLAGLFQPGGFTYRTIADVIALLPRGMQHAGTIAAKCVLRLHARGELDETATDAELARESERMAEELAAEHGVDLDGNRGWSASLIQKGLHAIHVELGKLGVPLIDRLSGIGMHGRRQIVIKPLAGRGTPRTEAQATGPPPAPPPEKKSETATTGAGSSSSFASLIGTGTDRIGPDPTDGPELRPGLVERRRPGRGHEPGAPHRLGTPRRPRAGRQGGGVGEDLPAASELQETAGQRGLGGDGRC